MLLTLFLACAPSASPSTAGIDAVPLATRIEDVTVYGTTALVRRTGTVERGGSYVIAGLPGTLDPHDVRVRCASGGSGDVVRVEVKERVQSGVPTERVQALRQRLTALQRELAVIQDEETTNQALREGLTQLMKLDAANHARDVAQGTGDAEAWRASFQFLVQRLGELARAQRETAWRIEDQRRAIQAVEKELGGAQSSPSIRLHDVAVELVAAGRTAVEVEYLVSGTGWTPAYDARASKDLSKVELTYRARVWQSTGEDWSDVELALSTARPQRGAQGPDPVTAWVDVLRPRRSRRSGYAEAPATAAPQLFEAEEARKADADRASSAPAERPFASVEDLGLSARFQLAGKATIQSRDEPTTVLVGETTLAIAPERWCVPALDTTVWLRAKTKNTSTWTLLPGDVAVFLGADYLGMSRIETVQPGQELTLHLGADTTLAVTRTQVEDLSKGPAFLSSRASKVDTWKTRIENHGAAVRNASGAVDVIVREVLPKSKDDRIEVAFTKAEPSFSTDERWKQDRQEKGIHTWVLSVPRAGAAELVLQTTIRYPKDAEIIRTAADLARD